MLSSTGHTRQTLRVKEGSREPLAPPLTQHFAPVFFKMPPSHPVIDRYPGRGEDQLLQKDMVNLIGAAVNKEMTGKKNRLLKVC